MANRGRRGLPSRRLHRHHVPRRRAKATPPRPTTRHPVRSHGCLRRPRLRAPNIRRLRLLGARKPPRVRARQVSIRPPACLLPPCAAKLHTTSPPMRTKTKGHASPHPWSLPKQTRGPIRSRSARWSSIPPGPEPPRREPLTDSSSARRPPRVLDQDRQAPRPRALKSVTSQVSRGCPRLSVAPRAASTFRLCRRHPPKRHPWSRHLHPPNPTQSARQRASQPSLGQPSPHHAPRYAQRHQAKPTPRSHRLPIRQRPRHPLVLRPRIPPRAILHQMRKGSSIPSQSTLSV